MFELPVLCDREKPIWPPVRMFKHSCAMSCSLAPAAALLLHPSVTQTAQAPGYIRHQDSCFSSPTCKRSSSIKCFPQGPVFQLPPYHCYFMEQDHALVPTGHFISGAAFAPPPFHTPRPQPRPALTTAEQGEDKHLPKSLLAPNNIFLPPQGRRTTNNSFICKSVKK